MTSVFEFFNRVLDLVLLALKTKKERDLQDAYKEINNDTEGYVTGDYSDGNTSMFTPSTEKPDAKHLREVVKSKL